MSRLCCLAVLAGAALLAAAGGGGSQEEKRANRLPEAAEAILNKAVQEDKGVFEVISLDPGALEKKEGENRFNGWKELGRVAVKEPAARKALLEAVAKGIKENNGEAAKCFNPRHGVHASFDGKTVDLVICFECLQIAVSGDGGKGHVLTTRSPEAAFDKVLKDANVPLAPKP
jgi:hypothetical protein